MFPGTEAYPFTCSAGIGFAPVLPPFSGRPAMRVTDGQTAAAILATRAEAQRAIEELRTSGFRDDQIGIIGTGPDYESAADALVAEGAAAGAAGGGAIGLMAGLA